MIPHAHLYQQISSNIKHSFILQQHILSQLTSKSQTTANKLYQYIGQVRSELLDLKENITNEWNPLQQQLITIVQRVANLYTQKIKHLEEQLAEQISRRKQRDIEINVLRNIINQHYSISSEHKSKDLVPSSFSIDKKDQEDKVKISEYITLSQSLAQQSALPSARTVEVPNTHKCSIKKKNSIEDLNISLELSQNSKDSIHSSNFQSMVLAERHNNQKQDIRQKNDWSHFISKGRQNEKSRNSSSVKKENTLNDSFFRVIRNKDIEWSECRLQPLRKSLFQRRKSQRL